mmetsp:Transcript_4926/g.17605  ORF Transcript_4926/g.17605 Transcript_4926/m.17605 type:complete len:588 (+) Transcript_4926:1148-2911(+)
MTSSIPQRQARAHTWVVGTVEPLRAHRLAAQARGADQDGRQMVGWLRLRQLVTHGLQQASRVGGHGEAFKICGLWPPLLVKTRRVDRLLNVHVVVHNVQDGVQHRRNDPAAARRAQHHHRLAFLAHNRGAHRRQRPLARRNRIGLALHEAEAVRHADLDREIVHLVVQQHTGAGCRDTRAEPGVERVGHRDGIAPPVGDRVVRGVAALVRRNAWAQRLRGRGLVGGDGTADLGGVGLVEQPVDRVLHEVGVAEVAVAVDIGMAHRLDLVMHGLRRPETPGLERVALQDVEDLADHQAPGTRRRRRDDPVAPVIAFDRRQFARAVLVQIRLREDAATLLAALDQRRSHPALVEACHAAVADRTQRSGEVPLAQRVAHGIGLTIRLEEDGRRGGVEAEVVGRPAKHAHVALLQHEALLCQRDGRRHEGSTLHGAVLLPRQFQPRHAAGNTHSQVPVRAQPLDDLTLLVQEHVRGRTQGSFLPEVQKGLGAIGQLERHEPTATQVTGGRVNHRQCVTHGHGGVHRIAAVLKHLHADFRGEVLGGHDHAVLRGHRCKRGRVSRRRANPRCGHQRQTKHQNPSLGAAAHRPV